MDTFTIFSGTASFCAGISAFCATYLVFHLLEQVEVEKQDSARQLPILFKMMLPFTSNVMPLTNTPLFETQRRQANEMILMAGLDQLIDANRFVAVQILLLIAGAFATVAFFFLKQPIMGFILLLIFFLYPKIWLRATVKKRHLQIQKALPNVLDLLTLSVEAGRDFLTALRDILARRRRDALGEELERAFREIQLGKQRRIALKELSLRVKQPDLTSVLNAIIQADELGVSIGQILKIQGDLLRGKRFNRAEKLANEAPVKMLFPLALFIMPAVIIILLGPILLRSFNILFK